MHAIVAPPMWAAPISVKIGLAGGAACHGTNWP